MKRIHPAIMVTCIVLGSGSLAHSASLHNPTAAKAPALVSANPWETGDYYEDAQAAVRRKAEARAEARRARLESQRWAGYSPLRPRTTTGPFTNTTYRYARPIYWYGSPRLVAPAAVPVRVSERP